jgi:hypothetical protein
VAKGLTASKPEMDCDQTAMGSPPITSAIIIISPLMSPLLGYAPAIRKAYMGYTEGEWAITLYAGPVRIVGANDCKCSRDNG